MGQLTMARCCWRSGTLLLLVLLVSIEAMPRQTWLLHHSSQVAQPIIVNEGRVSGKHSIPRFAIPPPPNSPIQQTASRRQDDFNALSEERPVQVQPGDTVSLVVRGRNPEEPQQFVDVKSLLSALSNVPPASDGAYHVFLAPPNYPVQGGQKFNVTYVAPPPNPSNLLSPAFQPQRPSGTSTNQHPPLFVAPLNYNVPQGYGRVQIPTKQVKFALHQQQQQQKQQPTLPAVPASARFPPPPPPPAAVPRNPPPPPPQPPVLIQQQRPILPASPLPSAFRNPVIPAGQQQPFRPITSPPVPRPSVFEQSLSDVRIQTGFVPSQGLEEPETAPETVPVATQAPSLPARPTTPQRKEPLVLAEEFPAFLQPDEPTVTEPSPEEEEIIPEEEEIIPEEKETPVEIEKEPETVPEPEAPVEPETPVEPVVEDPKPVEPQPIPVADQIASAPIPAEELKVIAEPVKKPAVPVKVAEPAKPELVPSRIRKPVKKDPVVVPESSPEPEVGRPIFPDFQSVRRQQINRQKTNNNQRIEPVRRPSVSSGGIPEFNRPAVAPSSSAGDDSGADIPVTFSFGQKIRPKVKTNALVSPPAPIPAPPPAPAPVQVPEVIQPEEETDIDPPELERDETFQTLESQNTGPSLGRGRIRFRTKPEENTPTVNTIPSPANPAGRGGQRIRSTTQAPTITTTVAATSTTEEPEEPEEQEEPVESTTAALSSAAVSTEASIRGDVPQVEEPVEEEEEEEEEEEVVVTEKTTEKPIADDEEEEDDTDENPDEEEEDQVVQTKVQEPVATVLPVIRTRGEEKPWSPYEAIRQMQIAEEKRVDAETPVRTGSVGSNNPPRIRGKVNFASTLQGSSSLRPAVTPVIRPVIPIRIRPNNINPIRTVPEEDQEVRILREGFSPVSTEFGSRGQTPAGIPAPNFPVGRRVPEFRPVGGQSIRIGGGRRPDSFKIQDPAPKTEQDLPVASSAEEEDQVVDEEEPLLPAEEEEQDAPEEAPEEEEEELLPEENQELEADEVVTTTTSAPSTTTEASTAVPEVIETSVEINSGGSNSVDERQVLGVSTATEVSLMYELCYRGRCVRVHE